MTDFHSHVLPNIDDGSRSVEESLAMLRMLADDGISTVYATPHFDATRTSPDRFFELRRQSYEMLKPHLSEGLPELRLGAEVSYYSGVSRMEKLFSMCLEGTKLLLLEMPMEPWSGYTVDEVLSIARSNSVRPLIAHAERYLKYQPRSVVDRFLSHGVLLQANASYFTRFFTSRTAIRLLRAEKIHLIGSDCHGLHHRPPKMAAALEKIERVLGPRAKEMLRERGRSLSLETYSK